MAWGKESAPITPFDTPATKRFVNRTGGYLQVTLVVRRGDDPKNSLPNPVSFDLENGKELVKQYSDAGNVYLNDIEVKLLLPGNDIPRRASLVGTRGSAVDNDYNTRDTMIFLYQSGAIILEVRNEGKGVAGGVSASAGVTGQAAEPKRYTLTKVE
jgi:hypothetical protein